MSRALLLPVLAVACAAPTPPPVVAIDEGAALRWDYRARFSPDGTLAIEARFPVGSSERMVLDEGRGQYVSGLDARPSGADTWIAAGCRASGCTLRYTFDLSSSLDAHARGFERMFRASDDALSTTPNHWLIRPGRIPAGTMYRLTVEVPRDHAFVTGLHRTARKGTYEAPAMYLSDAPYSMFGRLETVDLEGGRVTLAYPRGAFRDDDAVRAWAERGVRGLSTYFGALPVRSAAILLSPVDHRGVVFGAARGNGGASVQVLLGRTVDDAALEKDWILVHELVHLGFPNLPSRHRWMEEGLATYLETVIRARLGLRTEAELWRELAANMSQDDGPLNESRSWSSIYWGGATFCFLADVLIRERTGGVKSLEDALRAIVAKGGSIESHWRPSRVIEVGDRATGTTVLAELWASMAEGKGTPPDASEVLEKLGVRRSSRGVRLDDRAPWAAHRKAIAEPFGD